MSKKVGKFGCSLKFLLLMVTIVCLTLGYWTYKARQQSATISLLWEKEAIVAYDGTEGTVCRHSPDYFRDYVCHVTEIRIHQGGWSDSELRLLQLFPYLREIYILANDPDHDPNVSDDEIAKIERMLPKCIVTVDRR